METKKTVRSVTSKCNVGATVSVVVLPVRGWFQSRGKRSKLRALRKYITVIRSRGGRPGESE